MGHRCCGNGSSGGGEGQEEGARMTFLQGGPKFEVTPLGGIVYLGRYKPITNARPFYL